MYSITMRDLTGVVSRLNRETGHELKPYTKQEDGTFKPNAGNYHLDGACGGWNLLQMCDTGTGCKDIFSIGYMPKRALYHLIHAYVDGIEEGGKA